MALAAGLGLSLFCETGLAADDYLVCGPDEDGCYKNIYQYCNCIPVNKQEGNKPYCLDFDEMRCQPLEQVPDCITSLIFKDQASCVSTVFQSGPKPTCPIKPKAFCQQHNMNLCDEDGHPGSCKPGTNFLAMP